ncbi:hypothetical protein LTR08_000908 [Meristemomyces frigidus]|nr:hypothetical protein LTR08_000908 [Meristemomyces frigidus]
MSSEYNYDADAQFFPFFVLTITALLTLPLTYTLLRAPASTTTGKASPIASPYTPDNADVIDAQRAKQKRKERRLKRILAAAVGWATMAYMVYLMSVTARTAPVIWNPYDILDVGLSASEKQINSRYRRLSVTMHPDKRQPNAASNQTAELINDEWVEIVKAYKALTDDDVRSNWIQYGNPDGKQSTSFGIALPHFLVAPGSGKFVLALYGLLLGIGLPWFVGTWWYGMQSKTKERVLVTSAGNMFKEYRERMDAADVAAAVSSAMEFRQVLHGAKEHSGLETLDKALLQPSEDSAASDMAPKDRKALADLSDPVRRKTLALLWAYLTRLPLPDKALEAEKYDLVPTALQLTEAFRHITLAYGFTAPLLATFHLSQSLTQALPPTDRLPLLQLPHFTPAIIRRIEQTTATASKADHTSIQTFMALPPEQRQALAQAAGLTNDRLKTAEHVARQLPFLKVEAAFFKVQGEKYILPSSLVQFVVKARFLPPGTPNIPALKAQDLLDIDPAEGDMLAHQKQELEQHPAPLIYAPHSPGAERSPRWHVFLADQRQGKIAVPPFTFAAFDKRPFSIAVGGAGGAGQGVLEPTFEVVTLKMQFQAPPQAGEYRFQMQVLCDGFVGFDHRGEVVLVVEEMGRGGGGRRMRLASRMRMAVLQGKATAKGDQRAPRVKRVRGEEEEEESEFESGTDEDEESEGETDTDTDSSDGE